MVRNGENAHHETCPVLGFARRVKDSDSSRLRRLVLIALAGLIQSNSNRLLLRLSGLHLRLDVGADGLMRRTFLERHNKAPFG